MAFRVLGLDLRVIEFTRPPLHGFARENRVECHVDVIVRAANFLLVQESTFSKGVEILGCGEPGYPKIVLQEFDLGIGVAEQVVDQVLTVELVPCTDAVLDVEHCGLDGVDGGDGFARGLFDRGQHVEHPFLPSIVLTHGLQQAVVVRLGLHDIAAEVKHGDIQQPLLDQLQHVDDAAGAAVAIVERMDTFELMMDQRHLDQRIYIEGLVIVDEVLQLAHQRAHGVGVLGWLVNRTAKPILEGRTRRGFAAY